MQNIFQHILSFHLSYRDIITCTRVCHTWYRAFNPCLEILHEWYTEKTPQRFLSDAVDVDDVRLVDFARNVLGAKRFREISIKSQKMYNHVRDIVQNHQICIRWGDSPFGYDKVLLNDLKLKYGHLKRPEVEEEYTTVYAIYADNIELIQQGNANAFLAEMASIYGSFKCLDYYLSKITKNIWYRFANPSTDCVQINFEANIEKLVNDPKYNTRIHIDWKTVFKMSILNSSEKWFDISLERTEKPFSVSTLIVSVCKSRKILMELVDMFRDNKEIIEALAENGDKRVIEKINALLY